MALKQLLRAVWTCDAPGCSHEDIQEVAFPEGRLGQLQVKPDGWSTALIPDTGRTVHYCPKHYVSLHVEEKEG